MATILRWILDFFVTKPWALVLDLIEWLKDFVTEDVPNFIWHMLPSGVADYLSTFDLQPLLDLAEPVTWFIPLWSIATVYLAAYSLAASIRLVRFIIGWVPTIEG